MVAKILVTKFGFVPDCLTHWGRVTHICVSKLTIIGSDNGLLPGRRQAIIWNNVGMLLIWLLGTNFSEISIDIHTFSLKKIHFKMSSGKRPPFCLGLNVLSCFTLVQRFEIQMRVRWYYQHRLLSFPIVPNRIWWLCRSTLVEWYNKLLLPIGHQSLGSEDPSNVLETTHIGV